MNLMEMQQEIISAAQLAQILHKSKRTICNNVNRAPHFLPPFKKVGGSAIWLREDVLNWLKPGVAQSKGAQPPKRRGRPPKNQFEVVEK
jgi:predicted DNA-binding transcriptional regulator AlpA